MTQLPTALRPWAAQLAALDLQMQLALGPMVQRLATLVGPMTSRTDPGGAEPDGLSGLTRRGPYERLLLTEWAIADVAPDEFLRRASAGEHLFLDLQRRTPAGGRRCIVLLDAGPDQLGGPRVAHLALLIVLARRAQDAQATLVWATLQGGYLRQHLSRSALSSLGTERSVNDPTPAQLTALLERLGDLATQDELWLVGGERLAALGHRRASRLHVREALDLDGDDLVVRCDQGSTQRELRLPLPAPEVRTQLVRRPFSSAPPSAPKGPNKQQAALVAPVLLSSEGNRLLMLDQEGSLIAIRVPDRPERGRRKPRIETIGYAKGRFVAVGWHARRPMGISQHEDKMVLRNAGDGSWRTFHAPITWADAPVLLVHAIEAGVPTVFFTDAAGQLWSWAYRKDPAPTPLGEGRVLALTRRDGRRVTITAQDPHVCISHGQTPDGLAGSVHHYPCGPNPAAFIGEGASFGLVMYQLAPRRWRAIWGKGLPEVFVPTGWQPCGAVWRERHTLPGLLATSAGGTLAILGGPEPLALPADTPVVSAVASSGPRSRLAWLESSGVVVVWDLDAGEMVLRVEPPEAP